MSGAVRFGAIVRNGQVLRSHRHQTELEPKDRAILFVRSYHVRQVEQLFPGQPITSKAIRPFRPARAARSADLSLSSLLRWYGRQEASQRQLGRLRWQRGIGVIASAVTPATTPRAFSDTSGAFGGGLPSSGC